MPDVGTLSPTSKAGRTFTGGPRKKVSTAGGQLTKNQAIFADQVAYKTGLDQNVVAAWLLAEENGSAAQSREAAGNNDWLNIGYTDSANLGTSDSIWRSPMTAANATAKWLQGKYDVPGFGKASSGIIAFSKTANQSPQAQIKALQDSGWASSGYPDLPGIYNSLNKGTKGQLANEGGDVKGDPGHSLFTSIGDGVSDAASAVTSPINDIGKAVNFIFSKQFIYIIGGGMLLLVAIVMIFIRSGAASRAANAASAVGKAGEMFGE